MKLEFLDDISGNGKYPWAEPDKLIRLYSFDQVEAKQLIELIETRVINRREHVDLSSLDFIQPLNCSLIFGISSADEGIDDSPDRNFNCMLSIDAYKRMVGYMSAFVDNENTLAGYNWLYDPPTNKIDLLFSPGGTW